MTEAPSKRTLPAWARWCIICLGVLITVCVLLLALLSFLVIQWPLLIVLLFNLSVLVALVGLVVALFIFWRHLSLTVAVIVAEMTILAWFFDHISLEIGKTTVSELLELLAAALFFLLVFALPIGFVASLVVVITEWRKSGVRAAYPLLVYLVLAMFVWLVPIGGVIPIPSGHSDAAMEANFRKHRQQFDQLARILNDGIGESNPAQYRSVLQQTGLSRAIEHPEDGTIRFRYWEHRSWSGFWQERGYTYSKMPLEPVVASLDEIPADGASERCIYRKVADDWYMYYWRGDSGPHPCE